MAKYESTCPNCGAPVVFRSSVSIMVVCEYCDSTIVRKDLDLSKVGKMGELAVDASPLYLGIQGTFRDQGFTALGRLQIQFGAGVWNEWFIRFDNGQIGWIGEAQGEYMIYNQIKDPKPAPSWEEIEVGRNIRLGQQDKLKSYVVTDKRQARCVSGEGELPFVVGSGYEFMYADCRSKSKSVATIDYSESPPLQYEGLWVSFDQLNLQQPRTFHDWD